MQQVFQGLQYYIPIIPPALFYGLIALGLLFFCVGAVLRFLPWLRGASGGRDGVSHRGLGGLLALSLGQFLSPDCLLARRLFRRSFWRGLALALMLWGVVLTSLATIYSLATFVLPGIPLLKQAGRVASMSADLGGGLLLVGVAGALVRRYFYRHPLTIPVRADAWLLWLLFGALVSGFLARGERLYPVGMEEFLWHPFGSLFGAALIPLSGILQSAMPLLYQASYTLHGLLGAAIIAYLPYSKLFHIFAAQITTYAASARRERLLHERRGAATATPNLLLHRKA